MAIPKQSLLFDTGANDGNAKYTRTIEAPVYEPKGQPPHVSLLCDDSKTRALIRKIDASNVSEENKEFLRAAAWRHAVFHYENIANYYAHSPPAMQRLMEESALVIIDFDSAIERGFVKLCDDIRRQYLEEYNGDVADAS